MDKIMVVHCMNNVSCTGVPSRKCIKSDVDVKKFLTWGHQQARNPCEAVTAKRGESRVEEQHLANSRTVLVKIKKSVTENR
jgi:hypothetical protein